MKDILEKVHDYSLEVIMGDSFARYSKYIIQDRAIPDVRDGLKPVQRRILYSMYKEKNTYDKAYRKSAKTVGDVIGNYHPHGDTSIYDAMVRMSQDWKLRIPYIDMHGNNGSIDGDSPAAYRYTEARLSKISNELLKDITKNTVEMAPNFDDSILEPTVLPAKYPNLLVNGTTGISAGYATNIPPHNLVEVIDATIYRIDNPNCRLDTIMNFVKGPDFPTGGIIEGIDGIRSAYETGRGKIIVKAKVKIEKNSIIVTEIPYEVNKASLVKKMDEIRIDKKIDGIVEVRDESSREGLQIAIDVKKEINPELILNYLYKNTELQISYSFNMIAICNRCPRLLGIIDILDAYINHQKEVVMRRSQFDLAQARSELHILEGLIKAISILDDVIKTIRASKNKTDAKDNLVIKYQFTEAQAEAIVMLQLYRLSNTDIVLLKEKVDELTKKIEELSAIINDPNKLNLVLKDELREIKREYRRERITEIREEIAEIKIDNTLMIPKENVMVVVTREGYVKRVSMRSYGSSKDELPSLKEQDYVLGMYNMNTMNVILLFTNLGNYLYLPVHELPDLKWKEMGKHISNIITINDSEKIINAIPVYNFDDNKCITALSKNGMVKRTRLSEFRVQRYSKPISMMNLKNDDQVVDVSISSDSNILVATKNGYGLWYDVSEISEVGVKAAGVKAINLKNDEVVSGSLFDNNIEYITIITDKGTGKRIKISEIDKGSRANRGTLLMKEIKSNPSKINRCYVVSNKTILGVITDHDIKLIKLTEIPIMDRLSNGSFIVKDRLIDTYLHADICSEEDFKDESPNDSPSNEEKPVIREIMPKEVKVSLKEEKKPIIEEKKVIEEPSLEEIDERIMTIDDLLRDIEQN